MKYYAGKNPSNNMCIEMNVNDVNHFNRSNEQARKKKSI